MTFVGKWVIGAAGRRSERQVAKRIGAKLTPNSGARPGAKGDMVVGEFLVEAKSTMHESMSIKRAWLSNVVDEALKAGKYPAVSITFTHGNGDTKEGGGWVLVPERLFQRIAQEWEP
jgi:hypothetical protein